MSYPPNPRGGVPTKISVSPLNTSLAFGGTQQITATLTDAYGEVVAPSSSFSYASSNPALLMVNSSGLCTAVSPDPSILTPGGNIAVTVTYAVGTNTLSAVVTVTVTGTPAKTQAVVRLQSNQYGVTQSIGVDYHVVPESAPSGVYPSNWSIAPSSSE